MRFLPYARPALAILLAMAPSVWASPASDASAARALADGIESYAKSHPRAVRTFADLNDDPRESSPKWREVFVSKPGAEPFGEQGGFSAATVWARGGKTALVEVVVDAPSGDWSQGTRYTFRADGTLAKLDSTLATYQSEAPLQVHEVSFYDAQGRALSTSITARDAKTGRASKSAKYLKRRPPVFARVSRLPFYSLLKSPRKPG